jgi:hypothetical protein
MLGKRRCTATGRHELVEASRDVVGSVGAQPLDLWHMRSELAEFCYVRTALAASAMASEARSMTSSMSAAVSGVDSTSRPRLAKYRP